MNRSGERYKGQRNKEKYELYRCFKLRVIEDVYKNKLFSSFNNRCFKCGLKEKQYQEIGKPPILCIDHHVPMILGGHLIPGNLVALCRRCNNKKRDRPPEEFYTSEELDKLQIILEKQSKIFNFRFDLDRWHQNPQGYLIDIGVNPNLVHEMFNNPNHPDYIESNIEYFIEIKKEGA